LKTSFLFKRAVRRAMLNVYLLVAKEKEKKCEMKERMIKVEVKTFKPNTFKPVSPSSLVSYIFIWFK
jgi:hypothetical protein